MKLRWPWMSRKKHEQQLLFLAEKAQREHLQHRQEMERQRKQHQFEVDEIFRPVCQKIATVELRRHEEPFPRYALQVEMDAHWVHQCLEIGNSDREIDAFCRVMAERVHHEIKDVVRSHNIVRMPQKRDPWRATLTPTPPQESNP